MSEIKTHSTIDELEAILNSEEKTPVNINPDGTITPVKTDNLDYCIKPEWREAWSGADLGRQYWHRYGDLADLALHLCAKLLQSEFWREHKTFKNYDAMGHLYTSCVVCGIKVDPRHDYDWQTWIERAKGVLGG